MTNNKTSLEKSHSKVSNFKLTLICLFSAIFASIMWGAIGLAFKDDGFDYFYLLIAVVALFFSFLFYHLLAKFTR